MNVRVEIGSLRGLAADLHADIQTIEEIVAAAILAVAQAEKIPDLIQMTSVAGLLYHAYTGIETLCRRLVEHFEGPLVESADWHIRLMQRAATAIDGIRPAILAPETATALDPYRGFRHVFRHGYGVKLDWDRLRSLATALPDAWSRVRKDLQLFDAFLAACIRELELISQTN